MAMVEAAVYDDVIAADDTVRLFQLLQSLPPSSDPWGYWLPLKQEETTVNVDGSAVDTNTSMASNHRTKRARFEQSEDALEPSSPGPLNLALATDKSAFELDNLLVATLRHCSRVALSAAGTVLTSLESSPPSPSQNPTPLDGIEWWWRLHPIGSSYSSVQLHVDRDEGRMLQSQPAPAEVGNADKKHQRQHQHHDSVPHEQTLFRTPFMSCVCYLTDFGQPTVVMDQELECCPTSNTSSSRSGGHRGGGNATIGIGCERSGIGCERSASTACKCAAKSAVVGAALDVDTCAGAGTSAMRCKPAIPTEALVVSPKAGRMLVFKGSLVHGVLPPQPHPHGGGQAGGTTAKRTNQLGDRVGGWHFARFRIPFG
jgi:hypothetical protein